MTSSNINKIVRSNLQLKPWTLSKNSSEIVDECIKKIYKQMPTNFKHALKRVKVASPRVENMGPLRQFLTENIPVIPQISTRPPPNAKKPKLDGSNPMPPCTLQSSKPKDNAPLKKHTTTNLGGSNKRFLKSPNCKIYSSRRFGSSASSSRTSLFRRHDDRRNHRPYPNPNSSPNYLLRHYNAGQFDNGMGRHLIPSRNQTMESRLGSIPDAMKVSSVILDELMMLDENTLRRISLAGKSAKVVPKKEPVNKATKKSFDAWEHPPAFDQFRDSNIIDNAVGKRKIVTNRWPKESTERREATGTLLFRHPPTPTELFTLPHDRIQTELHEKHRRDRMKKLGLIKHSPPSSPETMPNKVEQNNRESFNESFNQGAVDNTPGQEPQQVAETVASASYQPALSAQDTYAAKRKRRSDVYTTATIATTNKNEPVEATRKIVVRSKRQPPLNHFPTVNTNVATENTTLPFTSTAAQDGQARELEQKPIAQTEQSLDSVNYVTVKNTTISTSPLAASVSTNKTTNEYGSYRYNRSNYISNKKY